MASWTNDTQLGGPSRGFIADLRDLVVSWREMAGNLRRQAMELDTQRHDARATKDRLLVAAHTYGRCADELDRRIVLDDGEGE